MAVSLHFEDIEPGWVKISLVSLIVKTVVSSENATTGDISVILCSDEYLLELNNKYLAHNYYTDIITFDYTEGKVISGDLFISLDRVIENANELGTDQDEEINRVIIHGLLHLLGYKDSTEPLKREIREKEDKYLKIISRLLSKS